MTVATIEHLLRLNEDFYRKSREDRTPSLEDFKTYTRTKMQLGRMLCDLRFEEAQMQHRLERRRRLTQTS